MHLTDVILSPDNKLFQQLLNILGQMVHGQLVRENEYLKVENEILRSKLDKQIRTTYQEKLKLIRYGLRLGGRIKKVISIVGYSTFRRWVIAFKDGSLHTRTMGRPRKTTKEIVAIILRMARENLDWGYGRIMGELNKLNIRRGRNTIKRVMIDNGLEPSPKRYEDSWDAYLKRTFETLWSCDFFAREIWTPFGKKVMFALFFVNIRTRKVHIAGITDHPTELWMVNRAKYMEQFFEDDTKKILIRDGDKKYTGKFDNIFKIHNTQVKQLPYRSPNLNPYCESWVGIVQRELLDKFFIFGETHFEYLVKNYTDYYNTLRPHSGLDNATIPSVPGDIKCESQLGGVIKHYYRE
jgi:putative transposase